MRIVAFVLLCLSLGCDGQLTPTTTAPASNPTTVPTVTKPIIVEQTPEQRRIEDFRTQVFAYTDEAMAGIKLLSVKPSYGDMLDAKSRVQTLYSRLPSTPDAFVHADRITDRLRAIASNYSVLLSIAGKDVSGKSSAEYTAAKYTEGIKRIGDDCVEVANLLKHVKPQPKK